MILAILVLAVLCVFLLVWNLDLRREDRKWEQRGNADLGPSRRHF